MSDLCWNFIARFIVEHPSILQWIIKNAMQKPYYHLPGYMDRWWLTPKFLLGVDEQGNPYPYKWVPMFLRVRVHHIKRPDNDRNLHDHPATNRSIILRNGYMEMDADGTLHFRAAGETVKRHATTFHRIDWVSDGGVWTMWFLSKKTNRWGFLVDGKKVLAEEYFKLNDY